MKSPWVISGRLELNTSASRFEAAAEAAGPHAPHHIAHDAFTSFALEIALEIDPISIDGMR